MTYNPNKCYRKSKNKLSDPFAMEDEWLDEIAEEYCCKARKSVSSQWMRRFVQKNQGAFLGLIVLIVGGSIMLATWMAVCPSYFGIHNHCSNGNDDNSSSPVSDKFELGIPDFLAFRTTEDGKYVAEICENSHLTSESIFLRTAGKYPKLLWQSKKEGYDVSIHFPVGWKYHGEQVVVMIRHLGASWAVADIIRTSNGKLMPILSIDADYFQFEDFDSNSTTVLVRHTRPHSSFDLPQLLSWNGNEQRGVVDTSSKFPEYFKETLDKNTKTAGLESYKEFLQPTLSMETRFDILQNLALSGKNSEAVTYLVELIKENNGSEPLLYNEMSSKLGELTAPREIPSKALFP